MRQRPPCPWWCAAIALALAPGCAPTPDEAIAPDEDLELFEPLSAREQLIRVSVDLRGIHPSEEELLAIEDEPLLYEEFVDRYLEDPRFAIRLREVFAPQFGTRTWELTMDNPIDELPDWRVAASLGDEPLRLVSHIVTSDLPWSEIVLAPYTMADPVVARMFELDRPESGDDSWQPATWTDARPAAGVLSMTSLWERYPSAGGNYNRHRANAVSRILLCQDYLDRPIRFTRAEVDQVAADPEDIIRDNQSCQSCHASLDPIAAALYGFFNEEGGSTYLPENERAWRQVTGRQPAWYGRPVAHLRELGEAIADDPRFADCALQTVYQGFAGRALEDADWSEQQRLRAVFDDAGLRIKPLIRAIVLSPVYRAAEVLDPSLAERVPTVRTATPAQLASIIEDLTGFRWEFDGRDGLGANALGLAVLAGAGDAYGAQANASPTVSSALVQERLAQAAAYRVALSDLDPAREGEARLLAWVTITDEPETQRAAFATQIDQLYLRVTGLPLTAIPTEEDPDGLREPDEIARLIALWRQIYSLDANPVDAWAGVVTAVLRDPRVGFY